jgi:integrase
MLPRQDIKRRCLKPNLWPEADRQAWEAAQRKGDMLEPGGGAADWRAHTRIKVESGYGRWLTWLSSKGFLNLHASPADRVTPERVAEYVAELRNLNASCTVLSRVVELYQAMTNMAPEEDWSWMRGIEIRIRHTAVPSRDKRSRLVPAQRLYAFGLELMKKAERPDNLSSRRAGQYRDGLIMSLLAARPLRRGNFTGIEVDRHLVRQGDGYWLRFESNETKTHQPIDVPLPAGLVPHMERYLSHYRPFLLTLSGARCKRAKQPPSANALWISTEGVGMTANAISCRIMIRTRAKFGYAMNMHLFRDCAATSTVVEDPVNVHIIKSVLGHSSLRSGEDHYIHARTLEAMRRHQAHILRLRRTRGAGTDESRDGIAPSHAKDHRPPLRWIHRRK